LPISVGDWALLMIWQRWQRYVSPDGKRSDAAHCYVHPLLQDGQHPNLHLLLESKVVRVIFDESTPPRAIGVEYRSNEEHTPEIALSKPVQHVVKASRLVVVTAGALGTPQVLERSGVGNPDILRKLDIPVIADVPGVGENYQDHHLLLYPYKTSLEPSETLDCILSGRKDFAKALGEKDPMLGWNGIGTCSSMLPALRLRTNSF
jgi:alcohol oxidase